MSGEFVVDASAMAKVFVVEPETAYMRAWLDGALHSAARLHAPSLLLYELANVVAHVRPRLDYPGDDPARALVRETTGGIHIDPDAWARVDPWLDRLSAYDASYLALAVAKAATLVTYDRKLRAVAKDHVPVLSPGAEASRATPA